MDATRRRGQQAEQAMRTAYRRLLTIAEAAVRTGSASPRRVEGQTTATARKLTDTLDRFLPLVEQVVDQTRAEY